MGTLLSEFSGTSGSNRNPGTTMPGGAETVPVRVVSPWAATAGRAAIPMIIVKASEQIPEPALAGEQCAVCMTFPLRLYPMDVSTSDSTDKFAYLMANIVCLSIADGI
jgi:hypothetical protein